MNSSQSQSGWMEEEEGITFFSITKYINIYINWGITSHILDLGNTVLRANLNTVWWGMMTNCQKLDQKILQQCFGLRVCTLMCILFFVIALIPDWFARVLLELYRTYVTLKVEKIIKLHDFYLRKTCIYTVHFLHPLYESSSFHSIIFSSINGVKETRCECNTSPIT